MSEDTASPKPWKPGMEFCGTYQILDADDKPVANHILSESLRDEIIAVVNAHDALVAEVERLKLKLCCTRHCFRAEWDEELDALGVPAELPMDYDG